MSLLPPNSTPVERAAEGLASHVRDLPVAIRDLWNPATCPPAFLPWLAWALSVDSWRSDWSVATKRKVIAASPRVHRLKGTVAAVRAAIAPFGQIAIREWFQDPTGTMAPHTFVVTLAPAVGGAAVATAIDDMIEAINGAKPLRSHFTVEQAVPLSGPIVVGGLLRPATFFRLTATGAA